MSNINKTKLSEDEIDIVKAIAKIRNIGCVNMFDRFAVIETLYCEGLDWEAEYISANKDDYLRLLEISSEF